MGILDIVRKGLGRLAGSQELEKPVIVAAQRMLDCRTAALGGHKRECPNGHFQGAWYNSCKHRFCPQ